MRRLRVFIEPPSILQLEICSLFVELLCVAPLLQTSIFYRYGCESYSWALSNPPVSKD